MKGCNHPRWIQDREKLRNENLFKKKCYKSLSTSLKALDKVKKKKTKELLGYTSQELQSHIESHPNWKNVKDYSWHLDHIYPIKAFVEKGITNLKIINHLDNLQPLLKSENLSKSCKYNKNDFEIWLKNHE